MTFSITKYSTKYSFILFALVMGILLILIFKLFLHFQKNYKSNPKIFPILS